MAAPAPIAGPVLVDATTVFGGVAAGSKPISTRNLFFEFKVASTQSFIADRDYWILSVVPSTINQIVVSLSATDTVANVTAVAGIKDLIGYFTIAQQHLMSFPLPNGVSIYVTVGAAARVFMVLGYVVA